MAEEEKSEEVLLIVETKLIFRNHIHILNLSAYLETKNPATGLISTHRVMRLT